jgi:hypothetical protein
MLRVEVVESEAERAKTDHVEGQSSVFNQSLSTGAAQKNLPREVITANYRIIGSKAIPFEKHLTGNVHHARKHLVWSASSIACLINHQEYLAYTHWTKDWHKKAMCNAPGLLR